MGGSSCRSYAMSNVACERTSGELFVHPRKQVNIIHAIESQNEIFIFQSWEDSQTHRQHDAVASLTTLLDERTIVSNSQRKAV